MNGPRWEGSSLSENLKYNFVMMKYITLLILLFSFTSCSQNNNKTEYKRSQEMSVSECDAILESYKKDSK